MGKRLSRFQVFWLAVLLFFVLSGVMSLIVWKLYSNKKAFILERNVRIFEDVYHSTLIGYDKVTRVLFEEVINTPEVIDLFKDAGNEDEEIRDLTRERLYKLLLPTYERMRSINLKQLHFHLPDATSFLRFHKPEKYGDNLTGIRYSLELANRERIYIKGFEEGRVYNGFRHVYPLSDSYGNHLGTVETSLSFNALRDDIEAIIGQHIDFVVKKSLVLRKVWRSEQSNYYPSDISSDYLYEQTRESEFDHGEESHRVAMEVARDVEMRMHQAERFAMYRNGYIISFLPIKNVKGDPGAAYLIAYNRTNAITQIKNDSMTFWAFGLIILASLSVVAYHLMLKVIQINEMATHDPLTRLYNRNSLTNRIEDEIARVERTKDTFCLIYMDVDNFRALNDQLGHKRGDELLVELSTVMIANMRRNDAVARWGGEEFMICLPHTSHDEALAVAEKLRHAIAEHDFGIASTVTCSMGVADYEAGETIEALLSRVDTHLYHAKIHGKNRVFDI